MAVHKYEHCAGVRSIVSLTPGAHAQPGLQYLGLCVCMCVCLVTSHLRSVCSSLKTLLRKRATKVKIFVGIFPKQLRSRVIPRNMSEKLLRLTVVSFLRLTHSEAPEGTQRCQQHSNLPRIMPTDAASPCWSENQHNAFS